VFYTAGIAVVAIVVGYASRSMAETTRHRVLVGCGTFGVVGAVLIGLAFAASGGAALGLFYLGALSMVLGGAAALAIMVVELSRAR